MSIVVDLEITDEGVDVALREIDEFLESSTHPQGYVIMRRLKMLINRAVVRQQEEAEMLAAARAAAERRLPRPTDETIREKRQ